MSTPLPNETEKQWFWRNITALIWVFCFTGALLIGDLGHVGWAAVWVAASGFVLMKSSVRWAEITFIENHAKRQRNAAKSRKTKTS